MAAQENFCNSRKTFWGFFIVSQVLCVFLILLYVIWECLDNKGFAWDYRYRQFAIHPLVMILSMVVLYGQGALAYRVLYCLTLSQVKYVHMAIMGVAFVLALFGIITVFVFHRHMHDGDMYTMHSWCGMLTVVAFGLQFIFGFSILLFTRVKGTIRSIYLPIHRYGSFAILALTAASVVSGVLDDIFLCMSNKTYAKLPTHPVVFNIMGITALIIIMIFMYLLYRDEWKRGYKVRQEPNIPEGDVPASEESFPIPETSLSATKPMESDPLLPSK